MKEEYPLNTERKSKREKIYSQKDVDAIVREKEIRNQSQYEILKETYQELLLLKKENDALKEKLSAYESPDDGYRKDWTWVAKIVFAIEKAGKPLRSAEIIEILEKREPHLREHTSKPQYFSAFINLALKNERIKREKRKGERGYYYYL